MFIGSGANWNNVGELVRYADGVIVSSSLKRKGKIEEPVDPIRVRQFVTAMVQGLADRDRNLENPSKAANRSVAAV